MIHSNTIVSNIVLVVSIIGFGGKHRGAAAKAACVVAMCSRQAWQRRAALTQVVALLTLGVIGINLTEFGALAPCSREVQYCDRAL